MKNEDGHFKLAGVATVGPKGQVVIPAEVREAMQIQPGDKLVAIYVEYKNAIAFITEAQAQTMVNKLARSAAGLGEALKEARPINETND